MPQRTGKLDVRERTRLIVDVMMKYGFRFLMEDLGQKRFWAGAGRGFFDTIQEKLESEEFRVTVQKLPEMLEELGPTFIKLGQFACSRPDLVSRHVTDALERLQENVKPVDYAEIEALVALHIPQYQTVFRTIDPEPLGVASIAQTHRAQLQNGRQVVMKIRKPGVLNLIEVDLKILERAVGFLARQPELVAILDIKKMFAVFAHSLRKETEFTVEAGNTEMFRQILANSAIARTPVIEWELTNDHILTMEYIDGYTVDQLLQSGDLKLCQTMARRFLESFLQQVVLHGVFHGDPHAGNIRLTKEGAVVYLDFGIVGRIESQMLELLVENFLAIARMDVEAAMNIAMEMGQPVGATNWQNYYEDMAELMFLFQTTPHRKNSFGQILAGIMKISRRHGLRMPDRFLLLGKAVVLAEGNAKKLDPEIDFLAVARPIFSQFARQHMSFSVDETTLFWNALRAKKKFNVLFNDLPVYLSGITRGEKRIPLEISGICQVGEDLDRSVNRVASGLIIASMLLAAAILLHSSGEPFTSFVHYLGLILLVLALLLSLQLFFSIFRQTKKR
ncbi:MAG TPA: AarF/UbiB family protein [Patescibacteria group bacterium]|nr:AarF/UbiB family protein [Patescibacteria group bacterium]